MYSLQYHFVFTTKYRKPVLVGEIGHTVRDLIREITARTTGDHDAVEWVITMPYNR